MSKINFGSKVKILKYDQDPSMIGRIGIVKKIGIHPDTACIVKVDDVLLKFRGLKNLKVFQKNKCKDLENTNDTQFSNDIQFLNDIQVLIEICKSLMIIKNSKK